MEWISTKDRLPEKWEDVLMLFIDKEICIGYLGEESWTLNDICLGLDTITHWMPLSDLPKEK
jgi:hypothetical protein